MIHEQALKRIGRYLLGTKTRGLILDPKRNDLGIDLFVDADFAGLWSYEDPQDPSCVKSRTGFVIQIAGCPVMWASRLQQEIALSTMQAEYTAMSMAMRDLLPFQRLAIDVCKAMGLDKATVSTIHSTVWEDNDGALALAKLPVNRVTPRSKHYAVKLHWFRSQLRPGVTDIKRVATDEQLADIFTKGLRARKFKTMRFKLMGW